MKRYRVVLVNAGLVLYVAGTVLLFVGRRSELWPLVRYAIYHRARLSSQLGGYRLQGVVDGPEGRELPLNEYPYIAPFDPSRLAGSLAHLDPPRASPAKIKDALDDVLWRYESRRIRHEHDGPKLKGLRLYYMTWDLDASAQNAGDPVHRELFGEITLSEVEESRSR